MKLPEAVEYLERNYDQYKLLEFNAPSSHGMKYMTGWVPNWDLVRSEAGLGPAHRQPMFTLKNDGGWADQWSWHHEFDFVPLSRESDAAPLWKADG